MIDIDEIASNLPSSPVREIEDFGCPKIASGKVREIYDIGDYLLLVASDRISAFDVVLPGGIAGKGILLTQLSHFWFEQTKHICVDHIVENQDEILRDELKLSKDMQLRSMVVKKLKPLEIECVVRGYIIGSGWSSYKKSGEVCGIKLPEGLQQAEKLPETIYTPTTKASEGHDMPVSHEEAAEIVGKEIFEESMAKSLELYAFGQELSNKAGIILADTKFEFGTDESGKLHLIDEVLTPDSSRYWEQTTYTTGTSPASFDKQIIRDYLSTLDWDKQAPGPELPAEIATKTRDCYFEALKRLASTR